MQQLPIHHVFLSFVKLFSPGSPLGYGALFTHSCWANTVACFINNSQSQSLQYKNYSFGCSLNGGFLVLRRACENLMSLTDENTVFNLDKPCEINVCDNGYTDICPKPERQIEIKTEFFLDSVSLCKKTYI